MVVDFIFDSADQQNMRKFDVSGEADFLLKIALAFRVCTQNASTRSIVDARTSEFISLAFGGKGFGGLRPRAARVASPHSA